MNAHLVRIGKILPALVTAVMLLAASGCGSDDTQQPSKPFNDADVDFALAAGAHLTSTVTAAQSAKQHSNDREVKRLAQRILETQAPHADATRTWLTQWGDQGADVGHNDVSSHDLGHSTGGFDDRARTKMSKAQGQQFDKIYLKALIEHLDAGHDTWQTETENGKYAKAARLAEQLLDEHAELRATAKQLLQDLK